ncbi:MAG TPA: ROK family transcriptional regulator [Actinocrinis sp.]|nr:ROK family transcriptional regulator [Actinocrinis sp.]
MAESAAAAQTEVTGPAGAAAAAVRPQPATPSTARAINDRAALDLFASRGPQTALDLAEATGLAKPTVADLLARLQERGLVDQIGEVKTDKRGPNAKLYALSERRACVAGIDARAAAVYMSLVGLAGQPLGQATVEVPSGLREDEVLDLLADTLLALAAQVPAPLTAITVGMPGLVDPATGQIGQHKMSPRWHTRLLEALRLRTGLDPAAVSLENEVNLAAIAEQRVLARQGVDTFALLWLGESIGAAVVLDGKLRRGASGGAGEIYSLPIPVGAPEPAAESDCGVLPVAALAPVRPPERGGGYRLGELTRAASLAELGASLPPAERLPAIADRVVYGVAAFVLTLDPGTVVLGGENGAAGGAQLAALVEERLPEVSPVAARVLATAVPGNAILAGAVAIALDRARAELWP